MRRVAVKAPGKALLCGEYAVLHGAPAIAVAVDRCAVATSLGAGPPVLRRGSGCGVEGVTDSPYLHAARLHAARALGRIVPDIAVDTRALYDGGDKIGLGSSAAVTVAAVGWAWHSADRAFADRDALFAVADAAHAEAQGVRGSGVDVACAVWGGAIRFQRKEHGVDVRAVDLPDDLHLTFIYTGRSASTAALLDRVRALAETQPARHEALIGRLRSLAHAFDAALGANHAEGLIKAAEGYGLAMAALGELAGCTIVTPEHAELARIARRHGGAAKPSGAGGGDIGVAFTVGAEVASALNEEISKTGLRLLTMGAPAPGLRLEMV
jgi:phosphomevalonate kinase